MVEAKKIVKRSMAVVTGPIVGNLCTKTENIIRVVYGPGWGLRHI